MKQFTWDEYYDGFYDWSLSTKKRYAGGITEFGPADEVVEAALEFAWDDEAFAARFMEKAMDAGVRFTPAQVLDAAGSIDKKVLGRMAETVSCPFDREQLEELYGMVDDHVFDRISRKEGIDIFDDDEPEEKKTAGAPLWRDADLSLPSEKYPQRPSKKKPGLLAALGVALGAKHLADRSKKHPHDGTCSGDCANCPPHYGYRYGRWYYGRGHQYGCEFGGSKGDGSL